MKQLRSSQEKNANIRPKPIGVLQSDNRTCLGKRRQNRSLFDSSRTLCATMRMPQLPSVVGIGICIQQFCCRGNWFLNFIFRLVMLVQQNAIDFYMCILYPVALLNEFLLVLIVFVVWIFFLQNFLYTRSCHLKIESIFFLLLS